MDGQRFDEITRALAGGVSRRRVLSGLVGSAIAAAGVVGPRRGAAQGGCSAYGRVCTGSRCCTTSGAICRCYPNGHCRCICPTNTRLCASINACVDTQTDAANCGACGNACAQDEVCEGGVCGSNCAPGVCAEGGDCSSQFCDTTTGQCQPVTRGSSTGTGPACLCSSDCTSNNCQDGTCQPNTAGGVCGGGGDCVSQFCQDNLTCG